MITDNMTNRDYALTLVRVDLPLVNRVARAYINGKVGPDAPLWDKEMAYNEWLNANYDGQAWERARLERASSAILNYLM